VQLAVLGQERGVPLWIDQALVLVEWVLVQRQLPRFDELLHLVAADSQAAHSFLHAHSLALLAQRRDILAADQDGTLIQPGAAEGQPLSGSLPVAQQPGQLGMADPEQPPCILCGHLTALWILLSLIQLGLFYR
jgi:hypothetical protein